MTSKNKAEKIKLGEQAFSKVEKINSELFVLTYGSLVNQLLKDFDSIQDVNAQLEKMGYNIGLRLIEEFLARSGVDTCPEFESTAEMIAKVGFKMFLGVTAEVVDFYKDKKQFSLIINDNPLIDFVELPPKCQNLLYSNIYCGVIRGALEMVHMKVECEYTKDVLRGDNKNEIVVKFKEHLTDVPHL